MLRKIKTFFRNHRKQKDGPRSTNAGRPLGSIPSTPYQRSSLELNHAATGLSTAISPPDPSPAVVNPTAGALLCPPELFSHTTSERGSAGMISSHPVDARAHIKSDRRLASRTPSPGLQQNIMQESPIVTDSHSIQRATFQQGTFANAQNVHISTAYMNDYGQSEDERRAEQERRTREELRAGEERKAREEERAEREKRAKEEREAVERRQEKEALERLAAKGLPGAMLDSKDRGYVPRCNEDTRRALRFRVLRWGRNGAGMQRLLWLSGPAGVGKSAVAQTVAEAFKEAGLLGAAFFFSRPNNRSDPDVLIPTLVYQLASLLPEYRRIISQLLIRDPLLLNKSRRSQFEELIINPFLSLTAQLLSITQKPLFILLDGLDECNGREAQREFVEMISHHTHKEGPALRLRWMVCSRPEPHLKVAFSTAECKAICLEEKLEVDDVEAQGDARRILAMGFAEIRQKYPDQLTEDWPSEDQLHLIADRASGHLGFVSFIIRFIGDEHYDDPFGQLEVCLRFLESTSGSTDINPLHPLDLLYTQILSDIPTSILPTTQRILGLFIFHGNNELTAAAHANFLGLNQAAFYRSLQRLHSVLSVPSAYEANMKGIQIYHASFSDYLKDQTRSGRFFLEQGVVSYLEATITGLQWLGYGHKKPSKRFGPELSWIPPNTSREIMLNSLCKYSFTSCWKSCPKVPEDCQATLFKALEKFDFNLDYKELGGVSTTDFAYFIRWLVSSADQHKTLVAAGDGPAILILHTDDPDTFGLPFPESMRSPDQQLLSLHLRVGKNNPVNFSLEVDRDYKPGFE